MPDVLSIQVGMPRSHGREEADDPLDRPWRSGIVKEPVAGPVPIGRGGLRGDGQADRTHHGGPDKAVCAYSADHYDFWRRELGRSSLPFGAFGENLTIAGLTEEDVCLGDRWMLGAVAVQVSQPRQPCWKLAMRFRVEDLAARVVANGKSGWYFRVLNEGAVRAGLALVLVERPLPRWTVARANRLIHHEKHDPAAIAELAADDRVAASLRAQLSSRAERARSPEPNS